MAFIESLKCVPLIDKINGENQDSTVSKLIPSRLKFQRANVLSSHLSITFRRIQNSHQVILRPAEKPVSLLLDTLPHSYG